MAIDDPTHLFVYGTLLRGLGHPMARRLLRQAKLVGVGSIEGRLYDLGAYPAAVAARARGERVMGEVYALASRARLLEALDRYEGCGPDDPEPHLYRRRAVEVRLTGGGVLSAWTYLCGREPSGSRIVPGGDYSAYRLRRRS